LLDYVEGSTFWASIAWAREGMGYRGEQFRPKVCCYAGIKLGDRADATARERDERWHLILC